MITTSPSLLARLQVGGETQAWARFVQLYTPVLYTWVRRQGISQSDSVDVVQEVFTVLVRKLPTFQYDRRQTFGGWLRTVTTNKCRDYFRRRCRRLDRATAKLSPAVGDHVTEFTVREYQQSLARRAMEIMQAEFQTTTWRACWEMVVSGRPASEIAEQLGITENAVYVAKSRVLRRLREELDGVWD